MQEKLEKVWIKYIQALLNGNCFNFLLKAPILPEQISCRGNLWFLYLSQPTHFSLLLFELFVRKNLKHIFWRTKKNISCLVCYSLLLFQLKSCCILSQSLDHASYFLYLHTRDFLLSWEIICPLHVLCKLIKRSRMSMKDKTIGFKRTFLNRFKD